MRCETCGRHKSPLEDEALTTLLQDSFPTRWARRHEVLHRGVPSVCIKAAKLWEHVFSAPCNVKQAAKVGYSLDVLGFERTYKQGILYFILPLTELT